MAEFLDKDGLQHYHQKITELIPTKTSDIANDSGYITSSSLPAIDDAISSTSSNAVQNKVIKGELDKKQNSLSTAQLNAANSGITSSKVSTYDRYAAQIAGKMDNVTLATVATTGSYNDLKDKPGNISANDAILTIQKNGSNIGTFTANASVDKTINITVPTDNADLANSAGYITGITATDVTSALGYTPYNSTNPNNYITKSVSNLDNYYNKTTIDGKIDIKGDLIYKGDYDSTKSYKYGEMVYDVDSGNNYYVYNENGAPAGEVPDPNNESYYWGLFGNPDAIVGRVKVKDSSSSTVGGPITVATIKMSRDEKEAEIYEVDEQYAPTYRNGYFFFPKLKVVSDPTSNMDVVNKKYLDDNQISESTVSGWGFTKNTGTYSKPDGGIPKTDLASAVQTSLGKADTALQSIPKASTTTLGGIKVGDGLSIDTNGVLKTTGGGGGGIEELTSPIRLWDLNDGLYKIPNNATIYYSGSTDTTLYLTTVTTGYLVMTGGSDVTKHWYLFTGNSNSSTGYIYNGYLNSITGGYDAFNPGNTYLTSISNYVKDNLDYSTSSTTYALSAHQGYVLDQKIAGISANKILWDGRSSPLWPSEKQYLNLREPVSEQAHGIILVYWAYNGSAIFGGPLCCRVVPKEVVPTDGTSIEIYDMMAYVNFSAMITKLVRVYDNKIGGTANNRASGTGSSITYDNEKAVIAMVLGF